MSRDQNRRIFIIIGNDCLENIVPGCRIHAADGLVQAVQVSVPAHNHDELHLFLGTLGHGGQAGRRVDAQTLEHIFGAVPAEVRVEIAEEVQNVVDFHPAVEIRAFRQVRDDFFGVRAGLISIDVQLSGGGSEQAVDKLDQGRLAAAVWS